MTYALTHAQRSISVNPGHTGQGMTEINSLKNIIRSLGIQLIIIGKGRRFIEMYYILARELENAAIKFSLFCGCEDSRIDLGKTATLVSGYGIMITMPEDDIWINDCPAFDAWKFIEWLPDRTLLLTGRPFMQALGKKSQGGSLYQIDPQKRSVKRIAKGSSTASAK